MGYTPKKKILKNDVSKLLAKRRMKFAEKYKGWTKAMCAYPHVRVRLCVRVNVLARVRAFMRARARGVCP